MQFYGRPPLHETTLLSLNADLACLQPYLALNDMLLFRCPILSVHCYPVYRLDRYPAQIIDEPLVRRLPKVQTPARNSRMQLSEAAAVSKLFAPAISE